MAEPQETPLQRIPQAQWRRWSGRQWKVLKEQSERYGFPMTSEGIDIAEFARWFHNFLSENAKKLNAKRRRRSESSPWLEKYRKERALKAELERLTLDRTLLPIESIQVFHNELADRLRHTREELETRFDGDVKETVSQAFEDMFDHLSYLNEEMFGPEQQKDE